MLGSSLTAAESEQLRETCPHGYAQERFAFSITNTSLNVEKSLASVSLAVAVWSSYARAESLSKRPPICQGKEITRQSEEALDGLRKLGCASIFPPCDEACAPIVDMTLDPILCDGILGSCTNLSLDWATFFDDFVLEDIVASEINDNPVFDRIATSILTQYRLDLEEDVLPLVHISMKRIQNFFLAGGCRSHHDDVRTGSNDTAKTNTEIQKHKLCTPRRAKRPTLIDALSAWKQSRMFWCVILVAYNLLFCVCVIYANPGASLDSFNLRFLFLEGLVTAVIIVHIHNLVSGSAALPIEIRGHALGLAYLYALFAAVPISLAIHGLRWEADGSDEKKDGDRGKKEEEEEEEEEENGSDEEDPYHDDVLHSRHSNPHAENLALFWFRHAVRHSPRIGDRFFLVYLCYGNVMAFLSQQFTIWSRARTIDVALTIGHVAIVAAYHTTICFVHRLRTTRVALTIVANLTYAILFTSTAPVTAEMSMLELYVTQLNGALRPLLMIVYAIYKLRIFFSKLPSKTISLHAAKRCRKLEGYTMHVRLTVAASASSVLLLVALKGGIQENACVKRFGAAATCAYPKLYFRRGILGETGCAVENVTSLECAGKDAVAAFPLAYSRVTSVDFSGTSIVELPRNFSTLQRLKALRLDGTSKLKTLPYMPLTMLEALSSLSVRRSPAESHILWQSSSSSSSSLPPSGIVERGNSGEVVRAVIYLICNFLTPESPLFVDLSSNSLQGDPNDVLESLFSCATKRSTFNLSRNSFSGSFPKDTLICQMVSDKAVVVDLSMNELLRINLFADKVCQNLLFAPDFVENAKTLDGISTISMRDDVDSLHFASRLLALQQETGLRTRVLFVVGTGTVRNSGAKLFCQNMTMAVMEILRTNQASLVSVTISNTCLGGHFPQDIFSRMVQLEELIIESNIFYGRVPALPPMLKVLSLKVNPFSGHVLLGAMPALEVLEMKETCVSNISFSASHYPRLRLVSVGKFFCLKASPSSPLCKVARTFCAESPTFLRIITRAFPVLKQLELKIVDAVFIGSSSHTVVETLSEAALSVLKTQHTSFTAQGNLSWWLRSISKLKLSHASGIGGVLPYTGKRLKYLSITHSNDTFNFAWISACTSLRTLKIPDIRVCRPSLHGIEAFHQLEYLNVQNCGLHHALPPRILNSKDIKGTFDGNCWDAARDEAGHILNCSHDKACPFNASV
eukprot:g1068.t1